MKQHSHILKNVRMLSCQKFKILQYLKFFFVLFIGMNNFSFFKSYEKRNFQKN